MLARASGVKLVPVHYRGSAPAWQDLLGSHVPSYISPFGNEAITRHKVGRARVLAITGAARSKALPDVPTFAEAGFKDLAIEEWFGLFAPAKTRPETLATLAQALRVALQSREFVEFLANYQSEPQISTLGGVRRPHPLGARRLGADRPCVGLHRGRITARSPAFGAAGS